LFLNNDLALPEASDHLRPLRRCKGVDFQKRLALPSRLRDPFFRGRNVAIECLGGLLLLGHADTD
jgi:hypothetical protein